MLLAGLGVAIVALALPLIWHLASPLFVSRTVSEVALSAASDPSMVSGHFGVVAGIH